MIIRAVALDGGYRAGYLLVLGRSSKHRMDRDRNASIIAMVSQFGSFRFSIDRFIDAIHSILWNDPSNDPSSFCASHSPSRTHAFPFSPRVVIMKGRPESNVWKHFRRDGPWPGDERKANRVICNHCGLVSKQTQGECHEY